MIHESIVLILLNLLSKEIPVCETHIVSKGDTLASISKKYTGTTDNWFQIYNQNNLRTKTLEKNQTIHIYLPAAHTWKEACKNIIEGRCKYHNKKCNDIESIVLGIEEGVDVLYKEGLIANNNTKTYMEFCYAAAATAEQESMFEFRVGGAGEVGMYQFKLSTLKLAILGTNSTVNLSDRELVSMLLDTRTATLYFVTWYGFLLKTCLGYKYCAWKKYNAGVDADSYASSVITRYYKIRNQKHYQCEKTNAN